MIPVNPTDAWKVAHPEAIIGLLELSSVDNSSPTPALDPCKREIETRLRRDYAGFGRKEFLALPVMAAYDRYYRSFEKTYHVLLQVESIVLKGKSLPVVSPLVDANFMAEVSSFVLTAGHDADKLVEPVIMDAVQADDDMTAMGGAVKSMRAGDMLMRDRLGVCCSILYGQDDRSPITAVTRHVLYVSYAPAGVQADVVHTHLRLVEEHVRLFSPQARCDQLTLLHAG